MAVKQGDAKCSAEAVSGFCLSCGCSAPPDGGCWKDQRGAAVVAEGSTGAYTGAETRPEGTGCAGVESREPVPVAQSAPLPSPAEQVPQQEVSGEIGKIEAMPEASARASCSEPARSGGPRNESALADAIEATLSGTQFEPMLNDAEWRTIINALREQIPARSGGPTLTPALSAWLEEIREYLSSRQDVRDGSDGPRPNEEMTLLANLDEALRRPTFPNGNTAGPSAVEEAMVEVIAEQHKVIDRLRADNLERGKQKLALMQEIDRLRAERSAALDLLAVIHRDGGHHTEAVGFIQSCADAIEARTALVLDNDRIRAENERLDHALGVAMQSLARATERAERAEAALAVEKEREGCAKVCEEMIAFDLDDPGKSAAAAIRRRGKP